VRIYVEGRGRETDCCGVAVVDGVDADACWMRAVPQSTGSVPPNGSPKTTDRCGAPMERSKAKLHSQRCREPQPTPPAGMQR
jgi:hypothetical protein